MARRRLVFSELLSLMPRYEFNKCVSRYQGNRRVRSFSCLDHFKCMIFAQLTCRESLRDIVTCLQALKAKLYHAGIRGRIAKSTFAEANARRDSRIYRDYAQVLIAIARGLYENEKLAAGLTETAYAFDSTTIKLTHSLFPWAHFKKHQGAIKLHTLLDLRGSIPSFIALTDGKVHDVRVLDDLPIEPGSIYVLDRGYIDFSRLYTLNRAAAYFIVRDKRNTKFRVVHSAPVDKTLGLVCDQGIELAGVHTPGYYPGLLRRVRYRDPLKGQTYVFLSNHFALRPLVIADTYKLRWQVELFFKWIKQHLRIKAFYGTSINAVEVQIWTAVSAYVLVAIAKQAFGLPQSLYQILQVLSVTLFEEMTLQEALTQNSGARPEQREHKQLRLFDF